MATDKAAPSCLRRCADAVEHGIAEGTALVARRVTSRPRATIAITLVVSLACATGFLRLKNENRPDKLYVSSDSRAKQDESWIEDRFGDTDDVSSLLLDRRKGVNLLDKAALLEVFDLYDEVLGLSAEGGKRGYDERSCAVSYWDPAGPCQKAGILAFWNWDRATLEADDDVLATVNAPAPDCCSPRGRETDLETVASKLEYDGDRVVAAGALQLDFWLTARNHDKSNEDPHNRRLESKFDKLRRRGSLVYVKNPRPLTTKGQSDNVSGAFDNDQIYINASFILIFLYAFWALHDRKDPYLSRGWLGVCAAFVVLVAVGAGFGLALWFGTLFSATASIAIFLILGIGLDDAFVICGAEANHRGDFAADALQVKNGADVADVAARRVVRAMATAGPSIFVTSVTDFFAFVAGSFTETPAIKAFCVFCATAVLTDYILQTTLFVAVLTLDMRAKLRRGARELEGETPKCSCTRDALGDPAVVPPREPSFFGGRYARCLLSIPGMAFVLLATGGLVAMGAYGASEVTAEFDYEWFLVDGWYRDNYKFQSRWFGGSSFYPVGVYTGATDYYEAGPKMAELLNEYAAEPYVVDSSVEGNWFDAHAAWADPAPTDSAEYLASLDEFLASPDGLAYGPFVVRDDAGQVKATRVDCLWTVGGDPTALKIARRMTRSRGVGRDVGGGLKTRFYGPAFVFAENIKVVQRESVFSMSLAIVTVGVVLLLLLGDVRAAALVGTMVLCVSLITYGSIWWYDDYLNSVSSFFVIIAVGLASDASAHYCHAFIESSKPTARERAVEALDLLGPSIFLGGTSTLLGICLTGAAITYVFQVFFRYLVTILVLSLWFGLSVMPVCCALLAPRPRHGIVDEEAEPSKSAFKSLDGEAEFPEAAFAADEPLAVAGAPTSPDA